MTAKDFNTVANAPQSYVFDLDREVAAFYRDHPEQKKKIFFIDASTPQGTLYRGEETDGGEIEALLRTNVDYEKGLKEAQEEGSKFQAYLGRDNYGCVFLTLSKPGHKDILGSAATESMSQAFIFDHETGHLLCRDGLGGFNIGECVADAYATLQFIRRFGKDSASVLQKLVDLRAVEIAFGEDGDHFTSPVVEKILADSQKTDFSALTPSEIRAQAQSYALNNALDPMLIGHIVKNFRALRLRPEEILERDFSAIKGLGDLVMTTILPEEGKWGAVAVRALLEGQASFGGLKMPKPIGSEWTFLRQAVEVCASQFDKPQPKLLVISQDKKLIIPGQ